MSSVKNFFYIAADIEICYTFPKIMLQFSQISIWQIHQASCFYEYGNKKTPWLKKFIKVK